MGAPAKSNTCPMMLPSPSLAVPLASAGVCRVAGQMRGAGAARVMNSPSNSAPSAPSPRALSVSPLIVTFRHSRTDQNWAELAWRSVRV